MTCWPAPLLLHQYCRPLRQIRGPLYPRNPSIAVRLHAVHPPQAYSPLAKAQKLQDPLVAGIAQRLAVTPAQVLIR